MAIQVDFGRADQQQFDDFYTQSRGGAVRLATLLLQDRAAAEDVVHDAYATMFPRWNTISDPVAYLRTVVVNGVRTRCRRAARERERIAALGPCGATTLHADEIADALAALPFRQRAVLVCCYYAGLRDREIAGLLECPVGTVKSLKARALAHLREVIDQ
jgi:DNA-directed RNA polymerase specialized sigma24 family protein